MQPAVATHTVLYRNISIESRTTSLQGYATASNSSPTGQKSHFTSSSNSIASLRHVTFCQITTDDRSTVRQMSPRRHNCFRSAHNKITISSLLVYAPIDRDTMEKSRVKVHVDRKAVMTLSTRKAICRHSFWIFGLTDDQMVCFQSNKNNIKRGQ